jgi:hypothetical protein
VYYQHLGSDRHPNGTHRTGGVVRAGTHYLRKVNKEAHESALNVALAGLAAGQIPDTHRTDGFLNCRYWNATENTSMRVGIVMGHAELWDLAQSAMPAELYHVLSATVPARDSGGLVAAPCSCKYRSNCAAFRPSGMLPRSTTLRILRLGVIRPSILRPHQEDSEDRVGAVFIGWRRTTSLFPPIFAVRSAANRHHMTFASVFVRQLLDVSDLEFNWRLAFDGPDLFEALQPFQQSGLHWRAFFGPAARSSSVTRASISSISMAFAE